MTTIPRGYSFEYATGLAFGWITFFEGEQIDGPRRTKALALEVARSHRAARMRQERDEARMRRELGTQTFKL